MDISIHSLRMEGDLYWLARYMIGIYFNPLPPHGGRRLSRNSFAFTSIFQSTPSAWRETFHRSTNANKPGNFNPLPPHGGRLEQSHVKHQYLEISIHSLRMEGDEYSPLKNDLTIVFQSTPSAWRETYDVAKINDGGLFQSTPSAWRETDTRYAHYGERGISIHSLRMEGDGTAGEVADDQSISIHSLRMEGDVCHLLPILSHLLNFNPLPPHGGRQESIVVSE